MTDHLVNSTLLSEAGTSLATWLLQKRAFVPGSDPSMGAGGAPQGGDPAAGGGAPPPAGGDPAAAGGAPPAGAAPAPAPPGGGMDMGMITQAVQMAMQQNGGGMGGPEQIKPKIDVNVELMQVKNMLALLCDRLGVQVPASSMVATPEKLTAMAQGGGGGAGMGGMSAGAGGAGGGGGAGAIGPMPGMQPAGVPGAEKTGSYVANGQPFQTAAFENQSNRAQAIATMMRNRR